MASWDQDIHRIQEIQQLLLTRQQYFQGQLETSFYKVDQEGNPKYFPTIPQADTSVPKSPPAPNGPSEPSIGQSLEANAGSSLSGFNDLNGNKEIADDISEGNCADHSHDDSSSLGSNEEGNKVRKIKKKIKKTNRVRRWVEGNTRKSSVAADKSARHHFPQNPPTTAIVGARKKSVSFDQRTHATTLSTENEDSISVHELERSTKVSVNRADPIYLLKKKSWLLRNEVARRLDDIDMDVDRKTVLHKVTKGTLAFARERLRKAERSLSSTVRDEQRKSLKPKVASEYPQTSLQKLAAAQSAPKPLVAKRAVSRLALRQQEEALRSDLNLREAFALIKINPDPLLDLASVEKEKDEGTSKAKKVPSTMSVRSRRTSRPRIDSTIFDDPETLGALRRLTRLSAQHKQKQKSLVPERINRASTATSGKSTSNLKMSSESGGQQRRSSHVNSGGTRESKKNAKRSKEFRKRGPKLAFSGLEAALRAERSSGGSFTKDPIFGIRVQKMAGTVL